MTKRTLSNILLIIALIVLLFPDLDEIKEEQSAKEEIQVIEDMLIKEDKPVYDLEYTGEQLLVIDKIDLKLVIKQGAIHENMKTSVATMTHEEVKDGMNFTLAGHRNLRRGKNFNRLDEVELGDTITVISKDGKRNFKVNEIKVVEPTEITILEDTGKTEITLITCYPIGISTHRLTIKGEEFYEKIS